MTTNALASRGHVWCEVRRTGRRTVNHDLYGLELAKLRPTTISFVTGMPGRIERGSCIQTPRLKPRKREWVSGRLKM